jgi:hypothetical protein
MAMMGKQFEIELTRLRCVALLRNGAKKILLPDFMSKQLSGAQSLKHSQNRKNY